jgi:hypothetical protein
MNLPQKDKFVHDILDNLKRSILDKVDQWPENWDGHEIRQFIADYYTMHYCNVGTGLTGKRKKDYKNTCLVSNLI